jgi:dipeptidyl aminopeptidase/acylaminoacyl peptidase
MATAAPTPFEIDDLYRLAHIEDPRISPDGTLIVFVRVVPDRVANGYRRAIYVVPTSGGAVRRFTSGTTSDHAPRWSPDGRQLAFVSNRAGGSDQLYVMPSDGGEAVAVTNLEHGASEPAWRPDGSGIAVLSRLSQDECAALLKGEAVPPPTSEWEAKRRKAEREHVEEQRSDPRVVTRLPYRGGTQFFDGRRNHILLITLPPDDAPPLPPRLLTDGDMHYSAPHWTPDGQAILTTATRDPEADSLFAYYDVLRVPVSDAPELPTPQRLTGHGFSCFDPQASPDGKLVAYLRAPDENVLGKGSHIALIPSEGGAERDLTSLLDLNVEWLRWSPDGKQLLFVAGWRGAARVYAVDLHGREQPFMDGDYLISAADVGRDGSVAFVAGRPANPCDVYLRAPDGAVTRLTQLNDPLLGSRQIAPFEEVVYAAPDGAEVQGWLLRPPVAAAGQRLPLAVVIHGGPHTMWGPGFRSMWHEWQTLAARGYVVFFCNPRGSEGYGELWRDALRSGWGTADAPDILAGIEAVKQRVAIHPDKICVTGGSYGGYMTAWLLAHHDTFAAAVAARGVYNLSSLHGTSDAHELIEAEFGGFPWEVHEELWAHSPLAHAHRITTPLLILHAERDYRVPISEAEQLFSVLRRLKRTVEFVRYPREGHDLTRSGEPHHRADHLRRTIEWFDRFTQG